MQIPNLKNILNTEKFRLTAVALSGILSSVAFFNPNLFFIQWFSYIPFFIALFSETEKTKRSFIYGFLFNFIKSVVVFSMFFELLHMDFGISKLMISPLIVLIIISVAAVQSIIFGFAAKLSKLIFKNSSSLIICIGFVSSIFTFAELSKSLFERILVFDYFGFPWVMTYITQQNFTCAIQSAAIFGAHFITLLVFLFNVAFAVFIVKKDKASKISVFVVLSLLIMNFAYGLFSLNTEKSNEQISVTIYQDNVSSYSKWNNSPTEICDNFVSDTKKYLSEKKTDVILMSETVFPLTLNSSASKSAKSITETLKYFSKKYNLKIVCGAFNKSDENKYNSLYMFDKGTLSEQIYNKRILVPFGEYMPLENTLSKILPSNIFNLSGTSLLSGDSETVITSDIAKFGTLICFDSIFDFVASESVREGAEIFLLSTNDSWYNDSAATKQHFGHAVFRAVENRRSVVRCAATGISGFINPYGQTLSKTSLLEKEMLTEDCELRNDITPFSRFGYCYLYLIILLMSLYYAIKLKKQ